MRTATTSKRRDLATSDSARARFAYACSAREATPPLLKWAGGKSGLLDQLDEVMASVGPIARYHEPFLGGAAVLLRRRPASGVVGDANEDLVNFYRRVAIEPSAVHANACEIMEAFERSGCAAPFFYAVRSAWNDRGSECDPVRRAGMLLFLNKACFNGLFRVNKQGMFNVPVGRTSTGKPPSIPSLEHLRDASAILQKVEIVHGDFGWILDEVRTGDLVYLDPPYLQSEDGGEFVAYATDGFGVDHHRRLATVARELVDRGARVVASNADVPLARELYAGFDVRVVSARRSVGARGTSRSSVSELILVGGGT